MKRQDSVPIWQAVTPRPWTCCFCGAGFVTSQTDEATHPQGYYVDPALVDPTQADIGEVCGPCWRRKMT